MELENRSMTRKILIAGVGNVLRRDDGFGVAVAQRLIDDGRLPPSVDIIETGIGGLSIVQRLMDGYQALIVVDAIDYGAAPGRVFVLEPQNIPKLPAAQRNDELTDLHLVEPSGVFALAKALDILPERVTLVGCQPFDCDELGEELSPPVQDAVEVAVRKVRELVDSLIQRVPCSVVSRENDLSKM